MTYTHDLETLLYRFTPTESELQRARDRRDSLVRNLRSYDIGFIRARNSGSYIKGTALHPLDDLDLFIFLNEDKFPKDNERLLNYLKMKISDTYSTSIVRLQNRSIGIIYYDDFRIDAVPAFYRKNDYEYASIYDKELRRWIYTSIKLQLEFFNKRKRKISRFVDIIKLLKIWKTQRRSPPSSFILELLAAKAFERDNPWGLDNKLRYFFKYIVDTNLDLEIYFTDYFNKSKFIFPNHPLVIMDPTNPKNNVAEKFDKRKVQEFINTSKKSLKILDNALDARSRSAALGYWYELFGPGFPTR